jgi:hypothetical protein
VEIAYSLLMKNANMLSTFLVNHCSKFKFSIGLMWSFSSYIYFPNIFLFSLCALMISLGRNMLKNFIGLPNLFSGFHEIWYRKTIKNIQIFKIKNMEPKYRSGNPVNTDQYVQIFLLDLMHLRLPWIFVCIGRVYLYRSHQCTSYKLVSIE